MKSLKRALDLFSPVHGQFPPDAEAKKICLSHKSLYFFVCSRNYVISLHTVSELSPPQPTPKNERVSCSSTKFSLDGSRFMAMKSDGTISIYDSASLGEVRSFAVANVTAAEISPCGTYLQTFQKPTTPQEKNVSLWNTETGDLAHGLCQKSITKTTW
ncbi:hypothetical protein YC2023_040655 [Brassica napus]